MVGRRSTSKTPAAPTAQQSLLACNHDRSLYRMSTEGAWCTVCNPAGPPFSGNPLGESESPAYAGATSGKRVSVSSDPVEKFLEEQAAVGERAVRVASDDVRALIRNEQGQMSQAILNQLREDLKQEREAWVVENGIVRCQDAQDADGELVADRLLYAGSDVFTVWPTAMRARFADEAQKANRVPWLMAKTVCFTTLITCVLVLSIVHDVARQAKPSPSQTQTGMIAPYEIQLAPEVGTERYQGEGDVWVDNTMHMGGAPGPVFHNVFVNTLDVQLLTRCWVRVADETPVAKILFEGTVPADWKKRFIFDEGAGLEVRSGCPGSVLYWLNGEHYLPPNESGKPEQSEVANIRP